jgi:hypothetical protein
LIKKKDLQEQMSGGGSADSQSIINQITDGAPSNLDSFAEVAAAINSLANVAYSGNYNDLTNQPDTNTLKAFKNS